MEYIEHQRRERDRRKILLGHGYAHYRVFGLGNRRNSRCSESCQIGLDADGKIVSMMVEHAGEHIDVLRLSQERIPA